MFSKTPCKILSAKGFTLVELLVVISIIGILSSLAIVSLNSARFKARDAQRLADFKQLYTALALYYDNSSTEQYPDMSVDGWWNDPNFTKFLVERPFDPINRDKYIYTVLDNKNNRQEFCIYGLLETEKSGIDNKNVYLLITNQGLRRKAEDIDHFSETSTIENCFDFKSLTD